MRLAASQPVLGPGQRQPDPGAVGTGDERGQVEPGPRCRR